MLNKQTTGLRQLFFNGQFFKLKTISKNFNKSGGQTNEH